MFVEAVALFFQEPGLHLDAGRPEAFHGGSPVGGIFIQASYDHPSHPGADDGLAAGGGAPGGGAGFQGDIEGGLGEVGAWREGFQGADFRMGLPRLGMVSPGEFMLSLGDDGPYHGIGGTGSPAFFGLLQGGLHPSSVYVT